MRAETGSCGRVTVGDGGLSDNAVGLVAAALLQSGTVAAPMVMSFTAGGMVEFLPALAVMLSADGGSALMLARNPAGKIVGSEHRANPIGNRACQTG